MEIDIKIADFSGYDFDSKIIYIEWHKYSEEINFKILVNEFDHEILHKIIDEFIDSHASYAFDQTLLQIDIAVGFNSSREFYSFLNNNGFKQDLIRSRNKWKGTLPV